MTNKWFGEIEKISTEINREDYDYEYFWHIYTKERTRELTKAILKRMRELGIKGCIRKISMRNIKGVGRTLFLYIKLKVMKKEN